MKTLILALTLGAVLFLSGCFTRQTATRLVYTPPPAPAASSQAGNGAQAGVLVIQAPAPPATVSTTPKTDDAAANPAPALPRKRKTVQPEAGSANAEAETTSPEPGPINAPALLPERSAQQQIDLEKEVAGLRGSVRQRIASLSELRLSTEDRKAVQDAWLFLGEADQAMHENNLQQALNLAQKADVLISAVEKRH